MLYIAIIKSFTVYQTTGKNANIDKIPNIYISSLIIVAGVVEISVLRVPPHMRSTHVVSSVLPVFVVHGIISQSSLQELGPRVPVLEGTAVCPRVLPDRVKACVLLFTEMYQI